MELDGLVYGLALRPDADDLRALGQQYLDAAQGDVALAVGWLLKDWAAIYSLDKLDIPQTGLVMSQARRLSS